MMLILNRKRFKTLSTWLIAVILFTSCIDLSDAGRSSGRGSSRGRGGSSGSRGSSSSSSRSRPPPVYHPSPPVHHPSPPVYRPSPPVYHPPVHHPSPPVYRPSPPVHQPISPPIHHTPNNQHVPKPSAPHPPPSSPSNPKDSSNILIHHEGGGRQHPPVTHDSRQTSPPRPGESINKANVPTSQGAPHGSPSNNYPPWANPGAQSGSPSASHPFPGSPSSPSPPFPGSPYPPSSNSHPIGMPKPPYLGSNSAPYPNTHPSGMPQSSHPQPGISSASYPNSHPIGMPKPTNQNGPIGFHPPGSASNHVEKPHQATSLGSSMSHPSGYPSSYGPPPPYGAPSGTHGGYGPPPAYPGHYGTPGYHPPPYGQPPNYHPSVGQPTYVHPPTYGAPMAQPFVPGQSVIVLPGQTKGPGLGQMVKEALVFSTINAGVNRIINGPSHPYHYGHYDHATHPSTSTVTNNTTIITNNYGPDGQLISPSNQPYPNIPNYPNNPNYSPNNPNNYPTGSNSYPSGSNNYPSGSNNYPSGSNTYPPGSNNYSPSSNNSGNAYPINPNPSGTGANNNNAVLNNRNNFPGNNGNFTNQNNTQSENYNNTTQPEEPPLTYYISENELYNLTEKLFSQNEMKDSRNYILNLQRKVSNISDVKDEAMQPLLYLDSTAYVHPTITVLRDIYDNYEFNSTKKENVTRNARMKENLLIDTFLNTDVMTTAIKWLQEKYYIELDDFEVKDTLRRVWFSRIDGYTSGFERIFMAEWYPGPSLLGGQNWIYFDNEEYQKKLNYLSYVDKVDLGNDKIALLKMNIEKDGVTKPNVTMLIGTPPELEMALYTVCYYARPNDICPISLGGVPLNLYTHSFRYFGKDLMDLGIIVF